MHGRVVPRLALGAITLGPDHARLVGRVHQAPAAGDLDAVAAGLVAVEEEALRDVVLGGGELHEHLVLDPDVGGAQAFLARVDPERRVVQAPVGAVRCVGVPGVDQLVCGDRHRHPRPAQAPVIELDALVLAVPERVHAEVALSANVPRQDVQVVEALDRDRLVRLLAVDVLVVRVDRLQIPLAPRRRS